MPKREHVNETIQVETTKRFWSTLLFCHAAAKLTVAENLLSAGVFLQRQDVKSA